MKLSFSLTRGFLYVLVVVFGLAVSIGLAKAAPDGGVVGNGTPGSCTEAALDTALAGGGTVVFNCGGPKTITLTSAKTIAANTTIDGGGKITLSGVSAVRLFVVNGGKLLTLKNIVLERGYSSSDNGGAIFNDGHLILDNTTIQYSYTPFLGGAIGNYGRLDITNSTLAHNVASSGGAIDAYGINAQVNITGSTFDDNVAATTGVGGAIFAVAPLTITNSEFSNNMAGSGGALRVDAMPVTINNSILRNNNGQSGGAIYVATGHLAVMNSTLSDNTSNNGGGIDNFASLALTNVTLSGNSAAYGGGIMNEGGTATLTNVTLSNNSAAEGGGGIFNLGVNTHLNLKNVIVANSPTGGNCYFSKAPSNSEFNLSSDNTCNFGVGRDGVNVLLGPLADNGGFTKTHLPQPGSPAIDNGTNAGCPATDQRGVLRPQRLACDVGAVEFGGLLPRVYLPMVVK